MNEIITAVAQQNYTSYAGYVFDLYSRIWQISKDHHLYLNWVDELLDEQIKNSFLLVTKYYAENYSPGHANNLSGRFREFARVIFNTKGIIKTITGTDLINYRSTLDREHEWYLGSIRVLIKKWFEFGYPGLETDAADLLESWRLRGNVKGRAVQILCPKEGPLSDLEFEGLHQSLVDAFEQDLVNIEDFVLAQLFMATGRRPSQIADLKIKDLIIARASDGLEEFILNVPRRKQQGSAWRQNFKPFALTKEVGILTESLIASSKKQLMKYIPALSQLDITELPIFPRWAAIKNISNQSFHLKTPELHRPTVELKLRLDKVIENLHIISERTGQKLKIFPTRLRRTLATRAAREGFGELVIAELLDHTDTQNARVYTENVPEHVNAINEAVARQLAPLAQAFAGVIVKSEKDAIRGNDLNSRVRCETGNVGTCGNFGFCGALAPIACYTCKNFQPWIDGPHEDVLGSLIKERERILELTQDKTMAAINDRTILAVTQVSQICESRKQEMQGGLING